MVLRLGALLLGEQLHRQHLLRRRQPGRRRSVHQERHGAPDLAGVAANKISALLRRDRQVPRPRHAEPGTIPRRRSLQWFSPAYHTDQVKWTSTVPAGCSSKPGGRATSSTTRTATRTASRSRAARRRGSPRRRADDLDLGGMQHARRPSQTHREPGALQLAGVGVLRDRLAQPQGRRADARGARSSTRVDANADLVPAVPQHQHRRSVHRCRTPWSSATRRSTTASG